MKFASTLILVILIGMPIERIRAQKSQFSSGSKSSSLLGEYKSANFIIRTDLDEKASRDLLKQLETMLGLVSRYWGRKSARIIEMYVVKDINNWPGGVLSPQGRESILGGGGVTITQKMQLGRSWQAKSIVYAKADLGTPQHEAIHAYCAQTYGSTGPVWYSEGMAEVGRYFLGPQDKAVRCDPRVIRYLKSVEPKPLKDIVDLNQFTGDSWQNYAWRWTLCHLLGFNENYAQRFKPLGLALMAEQPQVSFWSVYGSMAPEIEFEHQLFMQNFDFGYRVDLCSWDWKTRFLKLTSRRTALSKIEADHGWQATRLTVVRGSTYRYQADETWKLGEDQPDLTADGNDEGQGRLVGVILQDYQLSEPIEFGATGTWTAPQDGNLYVRCRDQWNELADNSGTIRLKFNLESTGTVTGR